MPPRGVIARTHARTAKALHASDSTLHPSLGFFNFGSMRALRSELARFRSWYSRRSQKAPIRTKHAPSRKRQANKPRVWNKKTKQHYARLRQGLRLQGFWESRRVSLWMAQAKLSRQTGTVPTERLWTQLLGLFPRELRRLSLSHFYLLSYMAFIRFNLRHVGKAASPVWADNDVLLAEQFESFMDVWFRGRDETCLPEDLVRDLLELFPDP